MPANFPEMWVNRVETNLTSQDQAPWLAGVVEIDTSVIEVGSGSASEQNLIHIPVTDFDIDILFNNTVYPLPISAYGDSSVTLQLDKLQTPQVPISDDQASGASYKRIDAATYLMTRAMLIAKYKKAIYMIAPAANGAFTPVVSTTGIHKDRVVHDGAGAPVADTPLMDGPRVIFVYDDIVALKKKFDDMEVPEDGRRLVLCSDHWNDLLLDRKRFGDMFSNYKTGMPAPMVGGFEIFQYTGNPYYNGTNKLAFGAVPAAGQYKASVAFYVPNIAKKTGYTRQYFLPSTLNPAGQSNIVSYRHYFMAVPKRAKYLGAIVSAYVAP
ncbi:hypothetical protein [Mucilaginibacter sp.]|uniref:hypothetical protein n=1 Tax=Mucilaginibacter sp. TaxID=1882438 RepID=UPI003262EFF3